MVSHIVECLHTTPHPTGWQKTWLNLSLKQGRQTRHNGNHNFQVLAGYRNTRHSVTGRIPAEILIGRAPRTRLSLVHPCLSQRMTVATEEQVGSHSPRTFENGQEVYLRDLRLSATSKWFLPA